MTPEIIDTLNHITIGAIAVLMLWALVESNR